MELDETLNIVCKDILSFFDIDRVDIIHYSGDYSNLSIMSECKSSPDFASLTEGDFSSSSKEFISKRVLEENKDLIINNIDDVPDYYKEEYKKTANKSAAYIPIKKDNDKWGILAVFTIKDYKYWSQDDINILHDISDYLYITARQVELYPILQQRIEWENLIRKIIEIVDSDIDIKEIEHKIVIELGQAMNAFRCFIRAFDPISEELQPVREYEEYLSSPDLLSIVNVDTELMHKQLSDVLKAGGELIVPNAEQYAKAAGLTGTQLEMVSKTGTMAAISLPIRYGKEYLGALSVVYSRPRFIRNEEVDLVRTVAKQTGIAMHQARLYDSLTENAARERLLRIIISDVKVSQDLDELYKYLLPKMTNIYNDDRALLVEMPEGMFQKPEIKQEYVKGQHQGLLQDAQIPNRFNEIIRKTGINLEPITINNTIDYYRDDSDLQKFFDEYSIKSLLTIPLVRYNHDVKILGILVITSKDLRVWTEDKVNVLRSITDQVANVIWEIMKRRELEELRNTFMLTLAHDLQVPIVGEHRALEFLISRPDSQPIGKYKEFIDETIKSNESLSELLSRLLDMYNYEAGKQELRLIKYNMSGIINDVVNSLKGFAQSKSMSINIDIQDGPEVNVDITEMRKVVKNLLENAIEYTQTGGNITIKSYKQDNEVITCISDNGPGISPEIRERIFERYAMARAIERKVGSGLGLYLAKQIVEAHCGKIWYDTKLGIGTTFCFSLPTQW